MKNYCQNFVIICLGLTACQSPNAPLTQTSDYSNQRTYIPKVIRKTQYANWACKKNRNEITPPQSPYCVDDFDCFENNKSLEQCKLEVEGYITALTKWKECIQGDLTDQAKNINEALLERINSISNSNKFENHWNDGRVKFEIIYPDKCSELHIGNSRDDLVCRMEKPEVPSCLENYDSSEGYSTSCQQSTSSFQDDLKEWLTKSIEQKNPLCQDTCRLF